MLLGPILLRWKYADSELLTSPHLVLMIVIDLGLGVDVIGARPFKLTKYADMNIMTTMFRRTWIGITWFYGNTIAWTAEATAEDNRQESMAAGTAVDAAAGL